MHLCTVLVPLVPFLSSRALHCRPPGAVDTGSRSRYGPSNIQKVSQIQSRYIGVYLILAIERGCSGSLIVHPSEQQVRRFLYSISFTAIGS